MGEIVNLGRARKAKRRADAQAQAATNRVAFGRTKSEKAAARREAERREHELNGARRDR
ncbi:DUF4169 family protein [Sphingomonas sp. DT-204]|uniref:DUF4169 family protein n=1 Tax=Sphingomonas sp. DT-204 TaxID=3396166 RepID=UPI003F1BFAA0